MKRPLLMLGIISLNMFATELKNSTPIESNFSELINNLDLSELKTSFQEIQNTSNLPILNPDFEGMQQVKLRLTNDLELLIISDPGASESAAAVVVNAGSWKDPEEYPGMAHFCEHMLFMGNEKYPDSNLFSSEVTNYKGSNNAYTASDKTVYLFSSNNAGYLKILDIFAHFFIDPIFDPTNISRELHAVDQEFALQKENDGWRMHMVSKELANPEHPFHKFSTGNAETLANIPQSALKKWHKDHYNSNNMKVILYSSLPLDSLKKAAIYCFSKVPKSFEPPISFQGSISTEQTKGKLVLVQPTKTFHKLSLEWELPEELALDASFSADLLAYCLGKGSEKNLEEYLKKEKLIDDLSIQVQSLGSPRYRSFSIAAILTENGLQKKEIVIQSIFQALRRISIEGIDELAHLEKNSLCQTQYQYMGRIDAYNIVSSIARGILYEDLSSFPRNTLLASEFSHEKIVKAISHLTPQNCLFTLTSPQNQNLQNTETWLKVPYEVRDIDSETLSRWAAIDMNDHIQIAKANPYISTDFSIIPNPELGTVPICFTESALGTAFYARGSQFQQPKAFIHLHINSPQFNQSIKNQILTSLLLDHITDHLNPSLTAAEQAGFSVNTGSALNKLHICLNGFSQKLPLLLQEVISSLRNASPTEDQFNVYIDRHRKSYQNSTKAGPAVQASDLLNKLFVPYHSLGSEKLESIDTICFQDFQNFYNTAFDKTYIEALFSGNISLKTAESCWLDIIHFLGKTPYPKEEHLKRTSIHLQNDEGPHFIAKETLSQGNATILAIDEGDFSHDLRSIQKILNLSLQEPFFDTLRTKQKTGYIARSSDRLVNKRLFQIFLVQSNSHQAEDLLHRFELFVEDFKENFSTYVTETKFETLKQSCLDSLKLPFRSLSELSSFWDNLAFEENADFSFLEKRIASMEKLSYEEFTKSSLEILSRTNKKRIAVLFNGKIPNPFAYTLLQEDDFSKIANYKPCENQ